MQELIVGFARVLIVRSKFSGKKNIYFQLQKKRVLFPLPGLALAYSIGTVLK